MNITRSALAFVFACILSENRVPLFGMRLGVLLTLAQPAVAFELAFPAACTLGETCYIQQYPDHDPGPGARDFTCGPLSYDGHDGTDIALLNRAEMAQGIAVLAAAAGTVIGLRDGVQDFVPFTQGQECGNGVVLDNGDGWQTQYCHMRQGSVAVTKGQHVDTGTPLGMVGQSGMADFPHVHLTVRHNGAKVDPFEPDAAACNVVQGPGLWSQPIAYQPGGLTIAGFSDAIPQFDAIKSGLVTPTLPATAPGLVLWVEGFGIRAGDTLGFSITGPQGEVLTNSATMPAPKALMFYATGKKLTSTAWLTGSYQGQVTLTRAGKIISHASTMVEIRVSQ